MEDLTPPFLDGPPMWRWASIRSAVTTMWKASLSAERAKRSGSVKRFPGRDRGNHSRADRYSRDQRFDPPTTRRVFSQPSRLPGGV